MLRSFRKAFSLVEITISLAILGFALAAIIGLLSSSLKHARMAADDTMVARMASSLTTFLRQQPFDALPANYHDFAVLFDESGQRLNEVDHNGEMEALAVDDALKRDAIYECRVMVTTDPSTVAQDGSANIYDIALQFSWPLRTPAENRTLHVKVARY